MENQNNEQPRITGHTITIKQPTSKSKGNISSQKNNACLTIKMMTLTPREGDRQS